MSYSQHAILFALLGFAGALCDNSLPGPCDKLLYLSVSVLRVLLHMVSKGCDNLVSCLHDK